VQVNLRKQINAKWFPRHFKENTFRGFLRMFVSKPVACRRFNGRAVPSSDWEWWNDNVHWLFGCISKLCCFGSIASYDFYV